MRGVFLLSCQLQIDHIVNMHLAAVPLDRLLDFIKELPIGKVACPPPMPTSSTRLDSSIE